MRDQDSGGGRQVARHARRSHPRRDGPREPATHATREGIGRTLRNSTAADGRPCGGAGGQGEPSSREDGFLMEVKPGYKQTEVGEIPVDWAVIDLSHLCTLQRGFDITEATRAPGTVPVYSS